VTTIVGAGAAGLSLAVLVGGTIYERDDTPGGLCRSTQVGGFTFDRGPHILGGIPEAVDWIVESTGLEFVEGRTRNVGYHAGEWVSHPFTDEQVGQAYMAKMWKRAPGELSAAGLGAQRGRKPGGVASFLYPKRGGYQAITDAWASRVHVEYGTEIHERDPALVWTAPVRGAPYNTLGVATVGLIGASPPLTAIYLPGDWTPFHRLSFPSNFAASNAPSGCFTVQGEVSYPCPPPAVDLVSALIDTVGVLLGKRGPVVMWYQEIVPDAYPVPTNQAVNRGHGRTGGHRYLNLDGVVAESLAKARVALRT